METIKGTVAFIKQQQRSTKNGVATAYNVKLDNNVWVSFGFKTPDFDNGDVVEFNVEGQYNNVRSHKVLSKGTTTIPPSNNRDRIIVRQNALGHATQIVLALLPAKHPTSDVVAERVIGVAEKLEHWVMNDKEEQ